MRKKSLLFIIIISLCWACNNDSKAILEKENYDGPYIEMSNVTTHFSDSTVIRLKMTSPLQQVYDNGDENYPEGLYLEIYNEKHVLTATYKSNTAKKNAGESFYIGQGNVIVINMETGDELNTEELYWYQKEELFKTDKFVTIRSEGELHTGEGLEANQDFSFYTIIRPTGTLSIDEGSTN
jgi:LPS export ABC transporter protein LptC